MKIQQYVDLGSEVGLVKRDGLSSLTRHSKVKG